jgi:hypothetical protein
MLDQLPPVRLHHDRRRRRGGEYDALRALDRHAVRRLVGARLIHPAGVPPDEFAECYNDLFRTDLDVCTVIERWARDALVWLDERQQTARDRRDIRLAARHDCPTVFAYRTTVVAGRAGFPSYRAMRTARGWPG